MAGMGFAGIDDAFELRVGQDAVVDKARRQMRPVGRACGGATEAIAADCTSLVGCGFAPANADRLQRIAFIERVGQAAALGRRPRRRSRRRARRRSAWRGLTGSGRSGRDGRGLRRRAVAKEARGRRAAACAARRHQADRPSRAGRRHRGLAGRGGKTPRVIGRDAVDHGQPRVDRRAVAGIGLAGDRRA